MERDQWNVSAEKDFNMASLIICTSYHLYDNCKSRNVDINVDWWPRDVTRSERQMEEEYWNFLSPTLSRSIFSYGSRISPTLPLLDSLRSKVGRLCDGVSSRMKSCWAEMSSN